MKSLKESYVKSYRAPLVQTILLLICLWCLIQKNFDLFTSFTGKNLYYNLLNTYLPLLGILVYIAFTWIFWNKHQRMLLFPILYLTILQLQHYIFYYFVENDFYSYESSNQTFIILYFVLYLIMMIFFILAIRKKIDRSHLITITILVLMNLILIPFIYAIQNRDINPFITYFTNFYNLLFFADCILFVFLPGLDTKKTREQKIMEYYLEEEQKRKLY